MALNITGVLRIDSERGCVHFKTTTKALATGEKPAPRESEVEIMRIVGLPTPIPAANYQPGDITLPFMDIVLGPIMLSGNRYNWDAGDPEHEWGMPIILEEFPFPWRVDTGTRSEKGSQLAILLASNGRMIAQTDLDSHEQSRLEIMMHLKDFPTMLRDILTWRRIMEQTIKENKRAVDSLKPRTQPMRDDPDPAYELLVWLRDQMLGVRQAAPASKPAEWHKMIDDFLEGRG